jgi:nickel superoxide dismutase
MRRAVLTLVVVSLVAVVGRQAAAHCEVPCGIYGDQLRFQQMLEDTATIAKAIQNIRAFAEEDPDANSINQVVRWVTTKESHATNTQHIIAQYFLTQRIKPTAEGYEKQLKAAHAVMVAAMKCKQAADPATAEALQAAIYDLYRAYEGKEPQFEE